MKWGNGLYSWELENICVKEEGQGSILASVFLLYLSTCFIWCMRCRWQCPVEERGAEETLSCAGHSWFWLALVDLAQSTKHSQKGKTPHSSCGRGVSEKRVRNSPTDSKVREAGGGGAPGARGGSFPCSSWSLHWSRYPHWKLWSG